MVRLFPFLLALALLVAAPPVVRGAGPAPGPFPGADPELARLPAVARTFPTLYRWGEPADGACPGWARARADVQAGRVDDRVLYWARLRCFAEAVRAGRAAPGGRDAWLERERGIDDVAFAGDADVRVLVTGFDPFFLERELGQSNPSGIVALTLDDRVFERAGLRIETQALIVPVDYGDFDRGVVERALRPWLEGDRIDLLVTVSMGRDAFDLERFPGRRRSTTAPDNRNAHSGARAEAPLPGLLGGEPLDGPEFLEFSLPAAAMAAVPGPYAVRDNRTVTTLEDGTIEAPALAALTGRTAVRGSGGGYLSNEISYRSLRLRAELGSTVPTGHLHTPRMRGHDADAAAAIVDQAVRIVLAGARAVGGDGNGPAQ